jgi:hypothetical protein
LEAHRCPPASPSRQPSRKHDAHARLGRSFIPRQGQPLRRDRLLPRLLQTPAAVIVIRVVVAFVIQPPTRRFKAALRALGMMRSVDRLAAVTDEEA